MAKPPLSDGIGAFLQSVTERQLSETDVQCLMWLVRWAVREYRRHRQFEDLLGAAYLRMWATVSGGNVAALPAEEVAKRVTKAAGWAARDWLRSAANEGRRHCRSHGRTVELPRRVYLEEWEWERRDMRPWGEDG